MTHATSSQPVVHARPVAAMGLALLLSPSVFAADRQWYAVSIDGERVGYGWIERSQEPGHRLYSEVLRVEVTQLRKNASIQTWRDVVRSEAGVPERIEVGSTVGSTKSGWQGLFSADARALSIRVDGTARAQTLNVPLGLGLPDRLPDDLAPLFKDTSPRLEFHALDPSGAQPVSVRAERLSPAGEPVVKIRLTRSDAREMREETIWLDMAGRLLHKEQPFFGATLVWEPCAVNCTGRVEKPYDLMARLIVQSPYRVPESAFGGPIRYVISRSDGQAPRLPVTVEQAVVGDGAKAIVTVCTTCAAAEELTAQEQERYLKPNAWVQSDAPEIRALATRVGHGSTTVDTMNRLVEAVRDHMNGTVEYLGYASALEALRSRSGDCTEFAVLLAALARARDIPTRVVYGLVYADRFSGKKDVFSPHAWVQSWTGNHWQSFDAGIGQFDATHLALQIGDGDPRAEDPSYMTPANVRIESLGRVR